jgi:bifunctional enzyme CysN/CysC
MSTSQKTDQMNIVIVGHVDHGKSTLIGRLLADTGSLPEGKLEQIKAMCEINSKPFEYAFLLDALKDERSQGITIDTARSFFKTQKRHYIIIDAPGHIEFLKNMITGAARAEAALLLIDANEGVKENSRRHGYMLSMLGIKQVIVLVNKMDLVSYDQGVYEKIVAEYTEFLTQINVTPKTFIPIAAREGDNIALKSTKMTWYTGGTVLTLIDEFEKEKEKDNQAFRMPVQDIYKFTEENDDRRIVAGTIETGSITVGTPVIFQPSGKKSAIKTIESFNTPIKTKATIGEAIGFTLTEELYIKPGELMCAQSELQPQVGTKFKANLFWLGKSPMIKDKKYKIKLGAARGNAYLADIVSVLDASSLESDAQKSKIERHDVAECIIETIRPIAFDLNRDIESLGRFVIIDDYEIAGGGIITEKIGDESSIEKGVRRRNFTWTKSKISPEKRARNMGQRPCLLLIIGNQETEKYTLGVSLEEALFNQGKTVYFLGVSNMLLSLNRDARRRSTEDRDDHIRQIGEIAHIMADAGSIMISAISEIDDTEAQMIKSLVTPFDVKIIANGPTQLDTQKADLTIDPTTTVEDRVKTIIDYLNRLETFHPKEL